MINVLVVDDNEVNTMILANMLELFDIHADQTNFGMQAVIMSRKKAYDIIFIDHIMPEMDGLQTTKAIRSISINQQNAIIVALTSNITDHIRSLYQDAGANALYSKPLSLMELISILNQWCPELSIDKIPTFETNANSSEKNNELIKTIIGDIAEINYFVGLRYAIGKPLHYINILEVSLKDIGLCIHNLYMSYENKSMEELKIGLHKIKSILTYIGAVDLSEEAKSIEKNILQGDVNNSNQQCIYFINRIENLKEELQSALAKYKAITQNERKEQELVKIPMQIEEYEQSLLNTIYYIKRFEYDAIMKELEYLILRGQPDLKQEFERALADVKEFNYEKALIRMIEIKK
ncbi:MAG: multi-sensor hybrid histidine kinase [Herbinix sp.]|nr:multi-sensor hybrid histidine kinase [Herbinix sp.]